MSGPATSNDRPAEDAGLINHLRAFAASAVAYLRARLQLAGLESKEAAAHYFKILTLLLAGLLGLIFGYVFFCIAGIFLIAHLFNVSWIWILLAAGAAHLMLAGVAGWIVRLKFARPIFSATITEFKKDQTWLDTPKPN